LIKLLMKSVLWSGFLFSSGRGFLFFMLADGYGFFGQT
jgi:hypothetical protein